MMGLITLARHEAGVCTAVQGLLHQVSIKNIISLHSRPCVSMHTHTKTHTHTHTSSLASSSCLAFSTSTPASAWSSAVRARIICKSPFLHRFRGLSQSFMSSYCACDTAPTSSSWPIVCSSTKYALHSSLSLALLGRPRCPLRVLALSSF